MPVSVLILTLNEEVNLPTCLRSVAWSDDVVVLDSYSTDRTVEIARQFGARVFQRAFDDWSSHQNWAVENLNFKHPWVYYSDADEVVTTDLKEELLTTANQEPQAHVAYRVRYKSFFLGRWIRHSSTYPVWTMRFFRPDKVRWQRTVNPVPEVAGPEGRLQGHFLHYSYSKGFTAWFEKHNRYSQQEAEEGRKANQRRQMVWPDILSTDAVRRRMALKTLSCRLPFRPTLHFLYRFVVRRGFLDGKAGLTFCRLMATYEYMIVLKMRELERREKGLPL